MAPRSKGWRDLLLIIRLLFTILVPNDNMEIVFSKLKHVKTNFSCSPGVKCLENILRIMDEGTSSETFDPMSAINKWSIDSARCLTKEKRPHSYRSRNSAKANVKSLSDND